MKSGWKTTEFWITVATVLGAVATVVAGLPAGPVAATAAGIASAAYAVSRALAKARDPIIGTDSGLPPNINKLR